MIASFDEVLSLDLTVAEEVAAVDTELEAFIVAKIAERKEAKKAKKAAQKTEQRVVSIFLDCHRIHEGAYRCPYRCKIISYLHRLSEFSIAYLRAYVK